MEFVISAINISDTTSYEWQINFRMQTTEEQKHLFERLFGNYKRLKWYDDRTLLLGD